MGPDPVRQWTPQPSLGWDGAHTRRGYAQAGRQGGVQVALCEEMEGTWEGFAIHDCWGTPLKQERLDSNLSRLVLTHATHPRTRTHAGQPRCTLPCHPVTLPACLPNPRSARRVAKVELFNPQHHRPNPKPVQTESHLIEGSTRRATAIRPAAET